MKKISIITIVKNNVLFIEHCIQSLLAQDYRNVEYIIIDGESEDGTLEIIYRYKNKIQKIISEKDSGIYDAMNKGIAVSSGDVIGFLHSDDFYFDTTVLSNVMNVFQDANVDGVYGDLLYVDRKNPEKIKRIWKSGEYSIAKMKWGWMPPHLSFFVRKSIYMSYGWYKEEYRFSADYELILRFLSTYKIRMKYLPQFLVCMRLGGCGNRSIYNRILANFEDRKAWRENGLGMGFWAINWKPIRKIAQFFPRIHKKYWELKI